MMRTFISHFTPSKYFYNFLIILVTHIFQSNKKPGKPLIVRAFPAFPGQSPTVPTISLFLTFILLGYTVAPVEPQPTRADAAVMTAITIASTFLFFIPCPPFISDTKTNLFCVYLLSADHSLHFPPDVFPFLSVDIHLLNVSLLPFQHFLKGMIHAICIFFQGSFGIRMRIDARRVIQLADPVRGN